MKTFLRSFLLTVVMAATGPSEGGAIFPRPQHEVGFDARAVQIADIDRDGDADVVSANAGSGSISVLLNNGSGILAPRSGELAPERDFAAGGEPRDLALVDLDGDGDLDVAVANFTGDGLAILLNPGTGAFPSVAGYGPGISAGSLAVADFDADGDRDVVLGDLQTGGIFLLRNDGSGNFGAAETVSGSRPVFSLAAGDVNGDGRPDVIAGLFEDAPENILLLLNGGGGTFAAPAPYATHSSYASAVKLVDISGDARADLVVTDFIGGHVSVLLNDGAGGFGLRSSYPVGPVHWLVGLVVEDFDEDGAPDVAMIEHPFSIGRSSKFITLRNLGGGILGPPVKAAISANGWALAVGHMDADGHLDIVASSGQSCRGTPGCFFPGDVSVLFGNGDGAFQLDQQYAVGNEPGAVTAGDLNGDRFADLAVAHAFEGYSLLFNEGAGTFGPATAHEAIGPVRDFAIADFTGDEQPDLVVVQDAYPPAIHRGQADGSLGVAEIFGTAIRGTAVAAEDLDGNGALDLAIGSLHGFFEVFLNAGAGVFPRDGTRYRLSSESIFSRPWDLQIGDFTGDGLPDVASANADETISLWPGTGAGLLGTEQTSAAGAEPVALAKGDLDGDRDLDLVVVDARSTSSGSAEGMNVNVLLNLGGGRFAPARAYRGGRDVRDVVLGDFDGDGDLDIVVSDNLSGRISLFPNDGHGSFGRRMDFGVGIGPNRLAAADVEADGDLDLAVSNERDDTVSVLLNRGSRPLDSDGDGLADGEELVRGTDPANPDTDLDGLLDGDEVRRGLSPLLPDSDDDGLPDGEEVRWAFDPLLRDSDGDGLPDGIDPDVLIAVLKPIPDPSFRKPAAQFRKKLFERIEWIQAWMLQEKLQPARQGIENLLKTMDGCSLEGQPDANDWLVDCKAQQIIVPHLSRIAFALAGPGKGGGKPPLPPKDDPDQM